MKVWHVVQIYADHNLVLLESGSWIRAAHFPDATPYLVQPKHFRGRRDALGFIMVRPQLAKTVGAMPLECDCAKRPEAK